MGTVLEALQQLNEPRSRQGRIYPLWKLVAIVLVAAMHGETSLRGMWRWGRAHADELIWRLRLWRYPGLSTLWYALQRVESGELEAVLRPWLGEEWAYAVDGKRLRGRKRAGERALAVLTMAGQELGKVVAQRRVDAANEVAAALALVAEVPLAGKVVSADAGIVHAPVVQPVVANGGAASGS